MIEVDGGHSGDNQASVLMDVIEDYDIAPKIGYLVMDNAFNNDTLVEHLEQQLLERHSVIWEPVHHRLRCNGHVINLAVQSFLFKADSEDLSIDNNIDLMETPTEQEMEMCVRKGLSESSIISSSIFNAVHKDKRPLKATVLED
jgi:hypothetical protein